jgi:RNA-binding protein YhbY
VDPVVVASEAQATLLDVRGRTMVLEEKKKAGKK